MTSRDPPDNYPKFVSFLATDSFGILTLLTWRIVRIVLLLIADESDSDDRKISDKSLGICLTCSYTLIEGVWFKVRGLVGLGFYRAFKLIDF